MPIYEYKCLECDSHVEKMQKTSDEPLSVCEKCGGKLEKQWSLSGFQFKGDGWYVTDYSSKGKDQGKEATADQAGKSEKSDSSDKAEKSSTGESTAKPETASNKSSDGGDSKKEAVSKKE